MTTIETRRYEMLVRVRQFGEAHRDKFPDSTAGAQAFATIGAAVTALSDHAVSKMSTAREAGSQKTAARDRLVKGLEVITGAARVIAEETPGFDQAFRLPPKRKPHQGVLTTGRLFVQGAEERKDRFITFGLPATFIVDLTALVQQFEQTLLGFEAGRDGQAAAKAGIRSALASGLAAARRLDILVPIQFAGDGVTMAVWERDRRVDMPPRRRRAPAAASAVSPAAPASVPSLSPTSTPGAPAVTPATVTPSAPAASAPVAESDQRNGVDVHLPVAS